MKCESEKERIKSKKITGKRGRRMKRSGGGREREREREREKMRCVAAPIVLPLSSFSSSGTEQTATELLPFPPAVASVSKSSFPPSNYKKDAPDGRK